MSKQEIAWDRRRLADPQPRGAEQERRTGRDRRTEGRTQLSLDFVVPVVIRGGGFVQWGLARNISTGGMLIELPDPPAIGSRIDIKFSGIEGSVDAPEPMIITGDVRHHVAWNFMAEGAPAQLSGMGVRFVQPDAPGLQARVQSEIARNGGTLH